MLSKEYHDKQKKKIVYLLLFIGIINTIYAMFQVQEMKGITIRYNWSKPFATGFVNNSNFFGTLMLLCLSFSLGLFIDEEKQTLKIIYSLLIFIFMTGLTISNTMSSFLGMLIELVFIAIYLIKKQKIKEIITITLILSLALTLITAAGKTKILKDMIKTKDEAIEITRGNINDKYGTNRIYIWKNTLKKVPDNLLTGVGIDNFYYAFGEKPLSDEKWIYDKAHNEYLQILITQGIFSLIAYLSLYGTIIIKKIKSKEKNIYLILPIIGYLTQAFFNISVIEVAPYFYISLGMLNGRCDKV